MLFPLKAAKPGFALFFNASNAIILFIALIAMIAFCFTLIALIKLIESSQVSDMSKNQSHDLDLSYYNSYS